MRRPYLKQRTPHTYFNIKRVILIKVSLFKLLNIYVARLYKCLNYILGEKNVSWLSNQPLPRKSGFLNDVTASIQSISMAVDIKMSNQTITRFYICCSVTLKGMEMVTIYLASIRLL